MKNRKQKEDGIIVISILMFIDVEAMKRVPITIAIVYHDKVPAEYFNLSLRSALSQEKAKFKIHVYTERVCYVNTDGRIHVFALPSELHGKPPAIREYIVNTVDTEYIAFWDSDDIYTTDRIYAQIQLIEKNALDYCFANFSIFDENQILPNNFFEMIGFHQRKVNIFDENYVGLGMITAKTDMLSKLLPFPNIAPLDWWIAIKSELHNFKSGYIDKECCFYRLHSDSQSKLIEGITREDVFREWENKIRLYKLLGDENKGLFRRYQYFKDLDINGKMDKILKSFRSIRYKNIWGGIIPYEKN